jgi:SAM-dependent methyltransferase
MPADRTKQSVIDTFDRAAAGYDRAGVDYFRVFGARLVEITALLPGQRVLDLGCGRGAVLFPAARAIGPGGYALGIDAAPTMVALTATEATELGLTQVEVRLGDADEPPGAPGEYDAVLAGLVLFFLPHITVATHRYAQLLRPGGLLAFSWFGPDDARWTPVFTALDRYAPQPANRKERPGPTDVWRTTESIGTLLAVAGYVDIETVEETFEITVPDFETWWNWSFSHGGRDYFEAFPVERHGEIKAAAAAAMGEVRRPDGSLSMRPVLRFTTARTRAQ